MGEFWASIDIPGKEAIFIGIILALSNLLFQGLAKFSSTSRIANIKAIQEINTSGSYSKTIDTLIESKLEKFLFKEKLTQTFLKGLNIVSLVVFFVLIGGFSLATVEALEEGSVGQIALSLFVYLFIYLLPSTIVMLIIIFIVLKTSKSKLSLKSIYLQYPITEKVTVQGRNSRSALPKFNVSLLKDNLKDWYFNRERNDFYVNCVSVGSLLITLLLFLTRFDILLRSWLESIAFYRTFKESFLDTPEKGAVMTIILLVITALVIIAAFIADRNLLKLQNEKYTQKPVIRPIE